MIMFFQETVSPSPGWVEGEYFLRRFILFKPYFVVVCTIPISHKNICGETAEDLVSKFTRLFFFIQVAWFYVYFSYPFLIQRSAKHMRDLPVTPFTHSFVRNTLAGIM